ncbi:MAG: SDR family NAD(P)-dependent oxidoreductase [Mycobacteriales bacterium]
MPAPQHAPYGATKAALVFWAQVLQKELRPKGLKVTCVCPSAVATPLLDDMPAAKNTKASAVKPATPEQIADAVLKAVDHDRFWVFPREARVLQSFQRHFPRLLGALTDRLVGT